MRDGYEGVHWASLTSAPRRYWRSYSLAYRRVHFIDRHLPVRYRHKPRYVWCHRTSAYLMYLRRLAPTWTWFGE